MPVDHSEGGRHPVVEFTASALAVMENEGKVRVGLRRHGKLNCPAKVRSEARPSEIIFAKIRLLLENFFNLCI